MVRLILLLSCSSQSGIRENVLLFLRIQMANCTEPPALKDKWHKKPVPSIAQLTSQLHTDILPESVVKSTVGCMDADCTGGDFIWNNYVEQLLCLEAAFASDSSPKA